mgnify:CR=1 FL=1
MSAAKKLNTAKSSHLESSDTDLNDLKIEVDLSSYNFSVSTENEYGLNL